MISLVDASCHTIGKLFTLQKHLCDNNCSVSLKKLLPYRSPIQFFTICLNPNYLDFPFKNTLSLINFFHEQINTNSTIVSTLENTNDLLQNKILALLNLEGIDALQCKLYNLDILYTLGVRSISFTSDNTNNGLSNFEKKNNRKNEYTWYDNRYI